MPKFQKHSNPYTHTQRFYAVILGIAAVITICVFLLSISHNTDLALTDPLYQRILTNFMATQPIGVSVSPNGQFILTKIEQSDAYKLSIFDRISKREIASNVSKNTQRSLTWSPNSQAIAYQEAAGIERPIYVLDIRSGKTKRLNAPISQSGLPPIRWLPDGKHLIYFQNGRLLEIDLEERTPPVVLDNDLPAISCDFALSPNGTEVATVADTRRGVISITEIANLERFSVPVSTNGTIGEIAWSPDGRSILVTLRSESDEFFKLFELETKTSRLTPRVEDIGDIRNPVWLPDGNSFVYHVFFKGIKSAAIGNRANQNVRMIGPSNGVVRITHVSSDGQYAYARYAGPSAPTSLLEIPLSGRDTRVIFAPPHSSKVACPEPEFINLKSKDGIMIPAFHWRSNKTVPPKSVLIVVHGGPHTQVLPTCEPYLSVMLEHNCDVIAVNYRGSTGYGQRFELMQGDLQRVWDVLAAKDYAVNALMVPPSKVFLLGSSYGAALAAGAAAQDQEIGGLILVSWVGSSGQIGLQFTKPIPIIELHGELDTQLSPADVQTSINQFFDPAKVLSLHPKLIVFRGEGHIFHNAGSLARVYWEAAKLVGRN